MNEQYHTHIEAKSGLFSVDFRELWKYRDLILLFTKRDFTLRYKQTILGPIWIILNPFITSVIYTIVFGHIAGISTNGVPQVLFYMGSNAIWSFFAACLTRTAGTFTSNAGIFGKVYFPRLTTPISTVISSAIDLFIQLLMFGLFWIYFLVREEIHPNWWGMPLLPIVLLQLGCLGMGFGVVVSSLTTKYRDLAMLVGFGVSLWMYATPVVYPLSEVHNSFLQKWIRLNPVTAVVELFRRFLFGVGEVSPGMIAYSLVMTALILTAGIFSFNRIERSFMDTV